MESSPSILVRWAAQDDQTLVATLLILMLAGAWGGFMSLLQRIQNTPTGGDPLISIFEIQNGAFSLYPAPVSGAIFAVLLYLIFLGKLVSGGIFPEGLTPFHFPVGPVHWAADPQNDPRNYAKLVVWSFIAGSAERFVPDTLGSAGQPRARGRRSKQGSGCSPTSLPAIGAGLPPSSPPSAMTIRRHSKADGGNQRHTPGNVFLACLVHERPKRLTLCQPALPRSGICHPSLQWRIQCRFAR